MSTLGDPAAPPPATRITRPGWRDPRLWVGVLIVAVSVAGGARLLAAADDSVAVWAARGDLPAGHAVTGDDLTVRRVRFVEPDDARRYLRADESLPAARLARGVGAGELLPRAALAAATDTGLLALPISVEPALLPPGVGAGSVVHVYVRPDGGRCPACAGPALADVTVVAAPAADDLSGVRQLVVQVPEADADRWFGLLAGLDGPVVTVASRG